MNLVPNYSEDYTLSFFRKKIDGITKVKRKGKAKKAVSKKKIALACRNRITLVLSSNDIEELDTYLYGDHHLDFKSVQFHQAKSKAIEEILDNCIDEFYRGHVTEVRTTLSDDKETIIIEDNGIGFPVNKAKKFTQSLEQEK